MLTEPERFTFTFEVLTPLYLGGPAPRYPQRSVASVKGALRFWYRTVSPEAVHGPDDSTFLESRIFGSTDGQSPFILRWKADTLASKYSESAFKRDVESLDRGRGGAHHNGLRYFGYPFLMRGGTRTAWSPAQSFTLEAVFPKGATLQQRQALTASVWLLGTLGGLGARSRRGFGSVRLIDWSGSNEEWKKLLDNLPLIDERVQQPMQWRGLINESQKLFSRWFGPWPENPGQIAYYPHLGRQSVLWLSITKMPKWQQAINEAGLKMQKFRDRRPPDAARFMRAVTGAELMSDAPERSTFGLPLAFRDPRSRRTMIFIPARGRQEVFGRWPSLLHIRLVKIGNMYHPLVLKLDGVIPGQADLPGVKGQPAIVTIRDKRTLLKRPRQDLLQVFINEQLKGAWPWMS